MRTRLFTGTLALLVAAGCGGGETDAVAWTDEVCGALAGFTRAATARPDLDLNDPGATVRGLGDYLGSTTAALDDSISRLDAAGAAPVDGGDEYVSRLTNVLTQIRASFDAARARIENIDPASSATPLATALPEAMAPLRALSNLADPTAGLRSSAELQAAAEQAPNCRQLRAVG